MKIGGGHHQAKFAKNFCIYGRKTCVYQLLNIFPVDQAFVCAKYLHGRPAMYKIFEDFLISNTNNWHFITYCICAANCSQTIFSFVQFHKRFLCFHVCEYLHAIFDGSNNFIKCSIASKNSRVATSQTSFCPPFLTFF